MVRTCDTNTSDQHLPIGWTRRLSGRLKEMVNDGLLQSSGKKLSMTKAGEEVDEIWE
jgi:hypothetical protein